MELALFFYLADVLPSMSEAVRLVGSILIVGLVFLTPVILEIGGMSWLKTCVKCIVATLVVMFITLFIPSKQTMYTMAAAYGVQTAAENPNVQRVAGKSLQVLEEKLDEYLKNKQ